MKWFRRDKPPSPPDDPGPSPEALKEAEELKRLRPRVEQAAQERDRLLRENNYAARIRAIYEGRAT